MHTEKIRYGDSTKASKSKVRGTYGGLVEPCRCIGSRCTRLATSIILGTPLIRKTHSLKKCSVTVKLKSLL